MQTSPAKHKQEKSLTTYLIDAAKLWYGKTRKKVNRMAEMLLEKRGLFVKKNIQWMVEKIYWATVTSLCQADSTAHARMDAVSQESISRYFDLLQSTLKEHQLEDCPGQIYNMDETGMPLDPRLPNIIAKSEGKLQACGNAIG